MTCLQKLDKNYKKSQQGKFCYYTTLIPNFGTRWLSVVSFVLRPFSPLREISHWSVEWNPKAIWAVIKTELVCPCKEPIHDPPFVQLVARSSRRVSYFACEITLLITACPEQVSKPEHCRYVHRINKCSAGREEGNVEYPISMARNMSWVTDRP